MRLSESMMHAPTCVLGSFDLLDARIATLADNGRIEDYETDALQDIYKQIEKIPPKSVD